MKNGRWSGAGVGVMMTVEEATVAVIDALGGLGVPFMLIGPTPPDPRGPAPAAAGAGFLVDLGRRPVAVLARRLPPGIRLGPPIGFATVPMPRKHPLIVEDASYSLEVFLLSDDPHDRERFGRRLPWSYHGREVSVPTAEDVVIAKLRWHHLAGRAKDRDDARDVLAARAAEGGTDWAYLQSWCDRHGTRALLDDLRRALPPS